MSRYTGSSQDVKWDPDRPLGYAELVPLADQMLMVHLSHGNHDALAVLFDRYHRLVLSIALRILHDTGEAEDVMQSVFLEIFQSVGQFDPNKGTAKVWILQYAYHRSFNRRRYLNLRGIPEQLEESVTFTKSHAVADTKALNVLETAQVMGQALRRLSKSQRKTLELAFYEGLTIHEIAQQMGISFVNTRHHYYRGLEKLRSILCDATSARMGTSQKGGVAHVRS
jgi:RNA polymerase sigma-70 factor, ECF subfamily